MGPKANKQREKQEQEKASSSARAHESLLSSFAGDAPTFIGFSSFAKPTTNQRGFAGGYASSGKGAIAQSIYSGPDNDIAMALKMLAKKGTVTKIKALNSFLTSILPVKQPAEIRGMMGNFVQLYTFEMRDQNDRKVRQLLNEVLLGLTNKLKPKAFAAHLKRLLPYWYFAMHDINKDVAALSTKAFETLFPENATRFAVVQEYLDAVLEECQSFFSKTPETFEGVALESDDREERFERCISAAILTIDTVINLFAEHNEIGKLNDESMNISVASMVSSDKFARLVTSTSKHPNFSRDIVRKATYKVIVSLCTNARSIIRAREEPFGRLILGILSDKSPSNHEDMWNALLTYLQHFRSVWHASESFPKFVANTVFPRLFAQIRHGFYGSARNSFPTLLPLLSLIPLNVIADPKSGQCGFYTSVLEQCLKFLDSTDARFNESYAITAFFECLTAFVTIFLNSDANSEWLGALNEDHFVAAYVNQFEKVFMSLLTSILTSPEFPERHAGFCITSLLTMMTQLGNYSPKLPLGAKVKEIFLQHTHVWIRKVLLSVVTKVSFVPSRMGALVCTSFTKNSDDSQGWVYAEWITTHKEVYRQSLAQLDAIISDSVFTADNNKSIIRLIELTNSMYGTLKIDTLLMEDETTESHFNAHLRSVVQIIARWTKAEASSRTTMRTVLEACRYFLVGVKEKKNFVLQLFQDFGVQYGDMTDATDIIVYGLRFPVTAEGLQLWLSYGSWDGERVRPAASTPTLEALVAIWSGKLVDEFLMISLKGRLDDYDSDTFASLLHACLGGESDFPVVSPDAVVILSHFALQDNASNHDMAMTIIPHLVNVFAKLDTDLSRELEDVKMQLYMRLFYISARGSHRVEANNMWEQKVLHSLQRWSHTRRDAFISGLASQLNEQIEANTTEGAAFNTKQFAAYVKKYLLLSKNESAFSVFGLIEKLDFIHARYKNSESKLFFYERLMGILGELCEDEDIVNILRDYLIQLFARNEKEATELMINLADLDVAHALTWFIFHSDPNIRVKGGSVDSCVEMLEHYLTLDHLYEALKSTAVIDQALNVLMLSTMSVRESEEHRNIIFANKNNDIVISVDGFGGDALTPAQHLELDYLVATTLSSFTTTESKILLINTLVEQNRDWSSMQPVVVSLFSGNLDEANDLATIKHTLKTFTDKYEREVESSASYFSYLRLITACWRRMGDNAAIGNELFDISFHQSLLSRMRTLLEPGSSLLVKPSQWAIATDYISALPSWLLDQSKEILAEWEAMSRLVITHAISGKPEVAEVTSLKIHKRTNVIRKGDDDTFVLDYSNDLITSRVSLLNLLNALNAVNKGESLHELTSHYREALLSTVLNSLSEGLELKSRLMTLYVTLSSPSKSFDLVKLSLAVEASLVNVLHSLYVTLTSIHDIERIRELGLEAFGGIEGLATLFDAEEYPMDPSIRVLLYILSTYTGALRLQAFDATTIDINADDEAATEAALAKSIIPKAVRKALRVVFSGEHVIRMNTRKQRPQERKDIVTRLLLWDMFLQLFPTGATAANTPIMVSSALSSYAAQYGLLANFLTFCSTLLSQESNSSSGKMDLQDEPLFQLSHLEDGLQSVNFDKPTVYQLGARVFFRTVVRLPAMVRTWWNDSCTRSIRSWAGKYFEDHITPFILSSELEIIQAASQTHSWDDEEMSVKGSRVSREIVTTYVKDECALEMVIRVPASYPLRSVEVECTKRIGITEDRWRRWVLQIIKVTSSQDGSLLDAVLLWKKNVDKEFEGVEPCPICYSILNPKTMGLPNLPCKTCSNKYHNSCLYKWFNQSGKNKCPICQQPFVN